MKIVALEAENIKYLKVVKIKPDGSLVIIGGDNAQGKTCVLDAIEYAMHGAGSIPSKPIRNGEKKARIALDLGDIEVIRTFTDKGTRLVVKNKDGATFGSPQAMLDRLVGAITFDPLEFSRMDASKQVEVLKGLVGLDFDDLNAQYKKLFDHRTSINRDGKVKKSRLDGLTKYENVPDKELSVQELTEAYTEAIDNNSAIDRNRQKLQATQSEIASLEIQLAHAKEVAKNLQIFLDENNSIDVSVIQNKIQNAEQTNIKIRANRVYDELSQEVAGLRKQSRDLTTKMAQISAQKEQALSKVKFPIDGLSLGDDGVIFEGVPFIQCSAAQRIRVSVAVGLAINPKLRVLLVREGSLLDSDNLAMIAQMANNADAQIWVERVSKGPECQVVIEDGSVKTD